MRWLLRTRAVRESPGPPRITILMGNAYGMSGVPHATFGLVRHLAGRHDVRIVNLERTRARPPIEAPERVTMVTLDDHLRRAKGWRGVIQRVLRRFDSIMIHPIDVLVAVVSLWTDVRLLRELRRIRSGIVISTRPSLTMLAAQMTRPGLAVVGWEHRDLTIRRRGMVKSMVSTYGGLSTLVVLTEMDRHNWNEALGGSTRVITIPNAVRPLAGGPSPLTEPVVVASGRLRMQKGFDLLIDAYDRQVAGRAPGWTLRILGEGLQRPEIEGLVAERGLGDIVELPGWESDIASAFERASIFALSSRSEGFPLILLEAMSKGLPVVAFDCPTGPADIVVEGETGFLIPVGDLDAFGEAVLELIRDEDKRRRFGAAGLERAREFEGSRVWPRWDRLIEELSGS